MIILALETSCDETAAAIVKDGRNILASCVQTQIELHSPFGGVIPELSAREHIIGMPQCIEDALQQAHLTMEQIDCFAATLGPGLVGSLLVGANTAKTLSLLTGKPFRGVNHLFGHVASNYLESTLEPPFLCLLVSGGHTQLIHVKTYEQMEILGESLDDAVGEAYDKIARMMELPYPGGPVLDKLAQTGNPKAYKLPIANVDGKYDFSFSGLKTATLRCYEKAMAEAPAAVENIQANIAASFQHTVVETLFRKIQRCLEDTGLTQLSIAGGVAANSGIRQKLAELTQANPSLTVFVPDLKFCTDNAAMIAASAYFNPITTDIKQEVFSRVLN